jgi:hypothetical protein
MRYSRFATHAPYESFVYVLEELTRERYVVHRSVITGYSELTARLPVEEVPRADVA